MFSLRILEKFSVFFHKFCSIVRLISVMSRYSVGTIIILGLVSMFYCNPAHNLDNENDVYFRMSGIFKMEKHQPIQLCHPGGLITMMQTLCNHGYNKRSFNAQIENVAEITRSSSNQGQ